MRKYGTGCKQSKIDGTEKIFDTRITLPLKFSLTQIMPPVLDQGETSKCVAYSLVACMDYIKNIKENDNNGEQFSINELYNMRKNRKEDGMDIKDGLSILVHHGLMTLDSQNSMKKIKSYAKVNSYLHLKGQRESSKI